MKKSLLLWGLFIIFGFSCTPNKDISETEIPTNIIPPDSMTIIISDIQATEAILREYKRIGQDNELRSAKFLDQTFKKHGISPGRFDESVAFYENHLELYHKIYTDVVSRLTQEQTELGDDDAE